MKKSKINRKKVKITLTQPLEIWYNYTIIKNGKRKDEKQQQRSTDYDDRSTIISHS